MIHKSFTRDAHDNYVYHRKVMDDSFVYLLLYVDNIIIVVQSMSQINLLKKQLGEEFEVLENNTW